KQAKSRWLSQPTKSNRVSQLTLRYRYLTIGNVNLSFGTVISSACNKPFGFETIKPLKGAISPQIIATINRIARMAAIMVTIAFSIQYRKKNGCSALFGQIFSAY